MSYSETVPPNLGLPIIIKLPIALGHIDFDPLEFRMTCFPVGRYKGRGWWGHRMRGRWGPKGKRGCGALVRIKIREAIDKSGRITVPLSGGAV